MGDVMIANVERRLQVCLSDRTVSLMSHRYVVFTSGRAHISLPNSTDKAIVHGGKRGLVIAADTIDISQYGHITTYPSNENTISINIPTGDGKIPEHKCLYSGPCKNAELSNL